MRVVEERNRQAKAGIRANAVNDRQMVLQGHGRRQHPAAANLEVRRAGDLNIVAGGGGDHFKRQARREEIRTVDFRRNASADAHMLTRNNTLAHAHMAVEIFRNHADHACMHQHVASLVAGRAGEIALRHGRAKHCRGQQASQAEAE